MMRIASLLLVCVLATTCGISGTFAKYVTTGSAADEARVAKWGVTLSINNEASFAEEYEYSVDNQANKGSVSVSAQDKVVAPGTDSEEVGDSLTFTIAGTPEVATRIVVNFEIDEEIQLAAGTYQDYTIANSTANDTFAVGEGGYYPVRFTLTRQVDGGQVETLVNAGTLTDVKTALTIDERYAPNATLDVTYVLTWAWTFEVDDKADTYLGMQNPAQKVGYSLNIRVEQVD